MLLAPDARPEVNIAISIDDPAEACILSYDACHARPLGCASVVPVSIILRVGEQGISVCDKDVGPVDIVLYLETQVL